MLEDSFFTVLDSSLGKLHFFELLHLLNYCVHFHFDWREKEVILIFFSSIIKQAAKLKEQLLREEAERPYTNHDISC